MKNKIYYTAQNPNGFIDWVSTDEIKADSPDQALADFLSWITWMDKW